MPDRRNRRPLTTVPLALVTTMVGWLATAARADEPKPLAPDHAANMARGLALFKEKVRPLFVSQCLDCHGGKAKKADFDLSDRKPLMDSGVTEWGGKASRLVALLMHDDEPKMPFKKPKLPADQIDAVSRWIDLGAPYDRPLVDRPGALAKRSNVPTDEDRAFWSFRPLSMPAPPTLAPELGGWTRTSIDGFVASALAAKGLKPNAEADRRTLIRRLSFDLIGLPPSPEEVEAFVADPRPDAYERLVDRLLASPRFGERWARHWMDVARFAESHGYEQDYDRPHAYPYRDFLIRAFNSDMPYDEFVSWQLAGDEMAPDDPLALAATGFLGAGAFPTQLTEAEFESARYNELDDMVTTTGTAFLGLTVGCARCHDHKFDPIPSDDYYRLASVFTTTIRSEIDLALSPGAKPTKVQVTSEGLPHTKHHADDRGFPHFYPVTHHLARGDVNQKKDVAEPGYLRVLQRGGKSADDWKAPKPEGKPRTSYRRAALASWMTDTNDGAGALLARVIVNRLWQHHIGRGIVDTPSDFGQQGEPPTHPELLDRLASELVTHGWSLKHVHRLIVTSATYRQGTAWDEARASKDRENTLYWRFTPRRLEAEPIRDTMLAVAGRLDGRMYGPGTLAPEMPRRAVYFFIKRSQLIPSLMLFDWPEHLVGIGRRAVTTTAPQALMFLNSPLGRSCAEGLAARVGTGSPEDSVTRAYALAYGRAPEPGELRTGVAFLKTSSLADYCQALMSSSEFIYIP